MTRKDFELIARVLRDAEPQPRSGYGSAEVNIGLMFHDVERCLWVTLADDFAAALADTNERFDRAQFLKAATGDRP
jgi:hypothetical protein